MAIGHGVAGLVLFGLAGEYYKLSDSEQSSLTEFLIRRVAGRVPVIISITRHAKELAVKQARDAASMGADALMILPPFFLAPSTEAIIRHIGAVAECVEIPIIIQYAPIQTGRIIEPSTFAAIRTEHPNITHVKVDLLASGPLITALHESSSGSLKTMLGYMGLFLPEAVARGVAGCMPITSLSSSFARLFTLLSNRSDEGYELYRRLLPLLSFMMQSVEMLITCEKLILFRSGVFSSAYRREPSLSLDRFQNAELNRLMTDVSDLLPALEGKNESKSDDPS